jgi:hypothetical protein
MASASGPLTPPRPGKGDKVHVAPPPGQTKSPATSPARPVQAEDPITPPRTHVEDAVLDAPPTALGEAGTGIAPDPMVQMQRDMEDLQRQNDELRATVAQLSATAAAVQVDPLDQPREVTPTMPGAPSVVQDEPVKVLGVRPPGRPQGWNEAL